MSRRSRQQRLELERLADACGIASSYIAANGETRVVSTETLQALIDLFERPDTLRAARRSHTAPIAHVTTSQGSSTVLRIAVAREFAQKRIFGRIQLEDGTIRDPTVDVTRNKLGQTVAVMALRGIPYGYHRIELRTQSQLAESLLIRAPLHAYQERPEIARWGLFAPAYALRSSKNWGSGDFRDLRELGERIGSAGGGLLGTLPLTATFTSFDPSPYSPASRLFWNEFYLHVPEIPEFATCAKAQAFVRSAGFLQKVTAFRRRPLVDYRAEMALKRQALEMLCKTFFTTSSTRRAEFDAFVKSHPQIVSYARFRAVMEQRRQGWPQWPIRLRDGTIRASDFQADAEHYHLYVQWNAEQQVNQLSAACRAQNIAFYLDVPLGVRPDSFDAWRCQNLFVTGATLGAPPDLVFTKGQDWGLTPLQPRAMREDRYRYYRELVRFQMRHASILRLDHVMGLHRLYWIPAGFPASKGAFVRYPAREFYAILCLESHRHKTALVGENLGTVPPEVNASMRRHRLSEMYVAQYELRNDPKAALRAPPRESITSLNTHDMPAFTAFWKSFDIVDRFKLGLLQKAELAREKAERRRMKAALVEFLRRNNCLSRKERCSAAKVLLGCALYLAKSDGRFLLLNLEDLWGETAPQNTPGTSRERPNWVRKTRCTLEQIRDSRRLTEILKFIGRARSSPARDHKRAIPQSAAVRPFKRPALSPGQSVGLGEWKTNSSRTSPE